MRSAVAVNRTIEGSGFFFSSSLPYHCLPRGTLTFAHSLSRFPDCLTNETPDISTSYHRPAWVRALSDSITLSWGLCERFSVNP